MTSKIKNRNKTRIAILLVLFFALSVISYQHVSASVSMNSINASNNPTASDSQQIAASGSNVDIVYRDAGAIYYDNNASGFAGTRVQQSNATASSPEIAVSGTDKHLVWLQSGALLYNNTGISDSAKKLVTGVASSATTNMLAVSGSDVHIVFRQSGVLKYINNTNSFANTASPVQINAGTSNSNQQLAVSGSALHITWQNSTGVYYKNNINNFANPALSLGTGSIPQLALSGSDVNFVWKDTGVTPPIKYASLTANVLSAPITLSDSSNVANNPKIATGGGNIYAVWQEIVGGNSEVFFASSAAGFTPVNLSNNAGLSTVPQIAVSGSNVIVTWAESTDGAIYMRSSSDDGNTFENFVVLSNVGQIATNPKLAVSGINVVSSWLENTGGFNNVFVSTGIISANLLEFDQSGYLSSDNPVVTYTNLSKAGDGIPGEIIVATISSTSDGIGISIDLTESGNTGIFTGTFSLTSGSSDDPSDTLKVASGDLIFASYSTESASSQITPITISLDSTNYDYGDIAGITVDDISANITPGFDTVTVHVITTQDQTGFDLILNETTNTSGEFTGNIAFMIGNNVYPIEEEIAISQNLPLYNGTGTQIIGVNSTTTPGGINLQIYEAGNSGIFEGVLVLSSTTTDASIGAIKVSASDFIKTSDPDNLIFLHGMISPNPGASKGIIDTAFPGGDTITVTYGLASDTAGVLDLASSGGGGGGVSRAGLVVQAVGAIKLFGAGGGISGPPSFDDKVFTLKQDGTKLDPNLSGTLMVGTQSNISMGFRMPGGLNELDHVGLYANIPTGKTKYDSDTFIYFDKYKTPQITITDPHGFFNSVKVDVTEPSKSNLNVNYAFDFAKSLDNSNIVFEAWNIKRDSALKEIPGLLKVGDTKIETVSEPEIISTRIQEKLPVPEWIKSNAAWWGKGAIDDTEFTNGIGYLIQKQIINVPELLQKNTSPDVGLMDSQEFTPVVPSWVKNNAMWWSEGKLTDDDFLIGIKYLLEQGIIKVAV